MPLDLKPFQGKIIYSLVSSAYFVDKSWGYGVPKAGMKLMFDIGQRHGIPITFLITSKVAQLCPRMLTGMHHMGGACVGLMLETPDELDPNGKRITGNDLAIAKMGIDEIREYIRNEVTAIQEVLPWAEIKVLGTGYRTENVVAAAEAEGLVGIWGYCIFQIGTDNITDFGCPWGQFFIDPNNFKAPSPIPSKMIGLEWTCRDLTKAFHMAKSESYSTDPNDVESNGKCTDKDIAYWIDFLAEYQRNLKYNDIVLFLQHQESHEMEWGDACLPFNKWRIDYTADMLDKFCAYVAAQPNIRCVTLNKACEIYWEKYQGITPPTYFYQQDVKIHSDPWIQHVKDNTADGSKHLWIGFNEKFHDYVDDFVKRPQFHFQEAPWHDALFYFDSDVQLVFDQGIREPVWISDYRMPNGSRDEQFMWTPAIPITQIQETQEGTKKQITYTINSPSERVYGIFEWINLEYGRYKVVDCSAPQWKTFEYAGVFIRVNLMPGENIITLNLEGQPYE